ncbi:MAG: hypothetical protein DRI94_01650 [Bacteroidetes bacterium]|nr:MAG: hypothetical protein DRI94_01650 [Bacteroidota bacterium]
MKKSILIAALFIYISGFSQKSSKMSNYYYDATFGEQFGIILKATDIVSKADFVKLGLEINNKSDNYVIAYKDKCKFVVNNNSYFPKSVKKGKILKPGKKETITVKSAGQTNYLVDNIDFKPEGFFTFPSEGKIIETKDFHLPPSENTIKNSSFKINMLKLKKQTDETAIKFKCTYTGNKIGIINPSQCVLRTEDGKEWAPVNSKEKIKILQKNESENFTLIFEIPGKITDMQFAEMDIVWKNTYSEPDLSELSFDIQHINIDKFTTKDKN